MSKARGIGISLAALNSSVLPVSELTAFNFRVNNIQGCGDVQRLGDYIFRSLFELSVELGHLLVLVKVSPREVAATSYVHS